MDWWLYEAWAYEVRYLLTTTYQMLEIIQNLPLYAMFMQITPQFCILFRELKELGLREQLG